MFPTTPKWDLKLRIKFMLGKALTVRTFLRMNEAMAIFMQTIFIKCLLPGTAVDPWNPFINLKKNHCLLPLKMLKFKTVLLLIS